MIRFYLLLVLMLVLSGCASRNVWVNPSKNDAEAQKDFRECTYDSDKSSFVPYGNGTSPISAGIQEGFQSVSLMNNCMRSRGYSLTNRQDLVNKKANRNQIVDEFNLAMKNEDYNKAFNISNSLVLQNPNEGPPYYGRGNAYLGMKKYNEAIADYNKAISLGFTNTDIFLYKAEAFIALGEYDIVIELINHALTTKNEASFYNVRAYALNKKGDNDKAMEDCNKSIALDNSKPNAYKNRGLAYYGKKEYEKAIEQFNKSISIDPVYSWAYDGRGDTYLKLSKNESAMSDFRKACELGNKESCAKIK